MEIVKKDIIKRKRVVQEFAQEFVQERTRMVENQLAPRDIVDRRVLDAMKMVPRHLFVSKQYQSRAYEDYPLPIGWRQTISQPYIVAYMTQALQLPSSSKVLEVGTGSGYQSAVLAQTGYRVFSIEIIAPLGKQAAKLLYQIGYNVTLKIGDGYYGNADNAPYDGILVTAAPEKIPTPYRTQLANGGRMIIPVGTFGNQSLLVLVKKGEQLVTEQTLPVRFVPLTRSQRSLLDG